MKQHPTIASWKSIVTIFVVAFIILVSPLLSVNGMLSINIDNEPSQRSVFETTQQFKTVRCTCYKEVVAGRFYVSCDYQPEFPNVLDDSDRPNLTILE